MPRRDRGIEEIIAKGRIDVHFQPQIDPATGEIHGVEALARGPDSERPDALFARAAASGLSERLSRLIQRKTLRQAAAWKGPLSGLNLSINVLPQELARPGYEQWLLAEIAAAGLAPQRITIEVIESGLITDAATVSQRLSRLRAAGIRVAVDDFGTGYASLAWLTSLPLDALKIDRSLIAEIAGGSRDRILVRTIIELAHDLGLKVVVEGVESTDQLGLLAEWGCDLYQGFLGAGALSEEELARFVAASIAEAA